MKPCELCLRRSLKKILDRGSNMRKNILRSDNCVRLYNAAGEHKLSLVPCDEDGDGNVCVVDLCTPTGKVLYC